AAADQLVGPADRLPERRVDDARVRRIDAHVDAAGFRSAGQDLLPRLAAITGAKDAAFGVGPVRVSERGDVGRVGILRMHPDLADVPRVLESEMRPRLAAVGRAVRPVPVRDVAADAGLAHARL